MISKEEAAKNMFEVADVLDGLGVVYWIDGGSLLGFYRDGDFPDDDQDDIDLFTWDNYSDLIPKIIEKAAEKGFGLSNHWKGDRRAPLKGQEISLRKNGGKIDINFFSKKNNMAWGCVFPAPKDEDGFSVCLPQVIPVRFYEELQQIEYRGRKFNIPRNIEGYLTHRYGDWRTPKHRSNYSWKNPEDLRALNKDFKFWE